MIDYFCEWAQNLTLAIVIVSLFEMLLPNNKTKIYKSCYGIVHFI